MKSPISTASSQGTPKRSSVKRHLKVFIASPSDTDRERDIISEFLNHWNITNSDREGIFLDVRKWETHAPVSSIVDGQSSIESAVLNQCELLIGIFWTKFFSYGKESLSKTSNEISRFITEGRPVIMYFIDRPQDPSKLKGADIDAINEFRNNFFEHSRGRKTVKSDDEIRTNLLLDLQYNIEIITKESQSAEESGNTDAFKVMPSNANRETKAESEHAEGWWKRSISAAIEAHIHESGYNRLKFNRQISFLENCRLWSALDPHFRSGGSETAKLAREYAFEEKYGDYDYAGDLRAEYGTDWPSAVRPLIASHLKKYKRPNVLAVASNDGTELSELIVDLSAANVVAIDLCQKALLRGTKKFQKLIQFKRGNMENISMMPDQSADLYLNLRSIHSSGVDMSETLAECVRLLSKDGLAVISVSNGYLDLDAGRKVVRGMYDSRNRAMLVERPMVIANQIYELLIRYDFRDPAITTGAAEIFVTALRPEF